jgi:hypothetical protein
MRGIKKLLKIPLIIHPYTGQSDALDNTYDTPRVSTCYGEGTMKIIKDRNGEEVVSELTLYVDGAEILGDNDLVVYYGKTYAIKALNPIRELNGDIALWMVYV